MDQSSILCGSDQLTFVIVSGTGVIYCHAGILSDVRHVCHVYDGAKGNQTAQFLPE